MTAERPADLGMSATGGVSWGSINNFTGNAEWFPRLCDSQPLQCWVVDLQGREWPLDSGYNPICEGPIVDSLLDTDPGPSGSRSAQQQHIATMGANSHPDYNMVGPRMTEPGLGSSFDSIDASLTQPPANLDQTDVDSTGHPETADEYKERKKKASRVLAAVQKTRVEQSYLSGTILTNVNLAEVPVTGEQCLKDLSVDYNLIYKGDLQLSCEGMPCAALSTDGSCCSQKPYLAVQRKPAARRAERISAFCKSHLAENYEWAINCKPPQRSSACENLAIMVTYAYNGTLNFARCRDHYSKRLRTRRQTSQAGRLVKLG